MRKIALIVLGIAVLAGAGWSLLWYLGRGEVDRRIALEVAGLDAQGWTVNWGTKTIGGFPFGYRIRMTDLAAVSREGGILVKIPELVAETDASAPERIVVDLPGALTTSLPIGEMMRQQNPLLPRVVHLGVESEGLRLQIAGLGGLPAYVVAAQRLKIAVAQDDFPIKILLEATDVEGALEPDARGRRIRLGTSALGLGLLDGSGPEQATLDARFNGLTLTTRLAATGIDDLIEGLVRDRADLVDGAFQSSGHEIAFASRLAETGVERRVTYGSGAQTGLFAVSEGLLDYRTEEREVTMALKTPGAAAATDTYRASAEVFQRALKVPVALVQPKPRDGALRISLLGVEMAPEVWQAVDPADRLDHAPVEMTLEMLATLRLTQRAGGPLPAEFSNISIETLDLQALGARARVAGDVEILQPINLPLGEFKVTLDGATALVEALFAAGLIPQETRDKAAAILEVYARRIEDGDRHETEITFANEGLFVNGLPVPPEE